MWDKIFLFLESFNFLVKKYTTQSCSQRRSANHNTAWWKFKVRQKSYQTLNERETKIAELSEAAACDGQSYTVNSDSPCTSTQANPLPFLKIKILIKFQLNKSAGKNPPLFYKIHHTNKYKLTHIHKCFKLLVCEIHTIIKCTSINRKINPNKCLQRSTEPDWSKQFFPAKFWPTSNTTSK